MIGWELVILVPGLMDGHLQLDRWMDTTRHHHPGMGRSAIIETTARAKVLWIMETNTNKTQRHHLLLCTHNGKSKTSLIHKQPTVKYMICVSYV